MMKGVVEINPEKLSGTPVFAGTRVPIKNLFDYIEGGETLEDFFGRISLCYTRTSY